jgi:hypothetical protein
MFGAVPSDVAPLSLSLTSPRESVDCRPDGRYLRVDLVGYGQAIPVASGIASRNFLSFGINSMFVL